MSVLNYKLGPWWADDYGDRGGRAKAKAKARDKRAWIMEVSEEMAEEEMQEVFIIENEWSTLYGDSGHENVSVHLTLGDAEDALYLKADALDVEIVEGEHSFNRYDSDDDDSDIYFIGSYTVGSNG